MGGKARNRSTGLVAALLVLVACGGEQRPAPTARRSELLLEGEVRERLDRDGIRISDGDADDRGVLVVLLGRPVVRRRERIRVFGEQRTLQVRAIEMRYRIDLDDARYRPFEGDDVVVARTVEILDDGP